MERNDCIVVGTGPAGVTAARALVERGFRVTMLDGGVDLEPERREAVERLARAAPDRWDPADVGVLREHAVAGASGIPLKRIYGSDFPYRDAEVHLPTVTRNAHASPSLARGGFGNVWGAVIAPWIEADLDDWPEAARPRAEDYRAALRGVDVSARDDALVSLLPIHAARTDDLPVSRQASAFLADAERSRATLEHAGVHVGRARLAVRASTTTAGPGCVVCGLCLYGCPYGLIWSARPALESLAGSEGVRVHGDVVVERVEERGGRTRAIGRGLIDGRPVAFDADRIFLACGTFATTRILLESLGAYDEPVAIRDSQYFLLPLLRARATPDVEREPLHTLAQAFVEIRDPEVSARTVHVEVFGYNDMLEGAAMSRLGPVGPIARPAVRAFVRRVLVGQAFLHSDVSPTMEARLVRSTRGPATLVVEGRDDPRTRATVRRVWRKLLGLSRALGAVPVPPLVELSKPGRGYHSGGAFPMRASPGRLQSDLWGRPHGFERVHVVDATVLPTIPATTITLPVMAHAHRIASRFDDGGA